MKDEKEVTLLTILFLEKQALAIGWRGGEKKGEGGG